MNWRRILNTQVGGIACISIYLREDPRTALTGTKAIPADEEEKDPTFYALYGLKDPQTNQPYTTFFNLNDVLNVVVHYEAD